MNLSGGQGSDVLDTRQGPQRGARKYGASDVHLIRGIAPAFRINGEIRLIEGEALEEETLRAMIDGLLTEKHREIFARDWQLCFSRHWPEVGRFRSSVYLHAGVPEMAIRLCEQAIRPRGELGLPPIVDELRAIAQWPDPRHGRHGQR